MAPSARIDTGSHHREVQGIRVPAFLYGTAWKEARTEKLTRQALEAGFMGIDTANQRKHYREAAVGTAVAASCLSGGLSRKDVFLQTKFTALGGQDHRLPYDRAAGPEVQVQQSVKSSLENLQTTYLDSYVLHGPSAARTITAEDWAAWRAMETVHDEGRTRLLGVSNVSLAQLRAVHEGSRVKPAFVQNRCYAVTGWDREVRAFCKANGMLYQAFSLLTANQETLRSPAVTGAATRAGRSAAQVVFRFALEVGMIPLTGTSSEVHMREDLQCFDFELEPAEVKAMEAKGA